MATLQNKKKRLILKGRVGFPIHCVSRKYKSASSQCLYNRRHWPRAESLEILFAGTEWFSLNGRWGRLMTSVDDVEEESWWICGSWRNGRCDVDGRGFSSIKSPVLASETISFIHLSNINFQEIFSLKSEMHSFWRGALVQPPFRMMIFVKLQSGLY